jgi:hypothetical protein
LIWLVATACVGAKVGKRPTITHRVFMDLTVDDVNVGRVVYGLFGKITPKTAENFRAMCTGELGISNLTGKVRQCDKASGGRGWEGWAECTMPEHDSSPDLLLQKRQVYRPCLTPLLCMRCFCAFMPGYRWLATIQNLYTGIALQGYRLPPHPPRLRVSGGRHYARQWRWGREYLRQIFRE